MASDLGTYTAPLFLSILERVRGFCKIALLCGRPGVSPGSPARPLTDVDICPAMQSTYGRATLPAEDPPRRAEPYAASARGPNGGSAGASPSQTPSPSMRPWGEITALPSPVITKPQKPVTLWGKLKPHLLSIPHQSSPPAFRNCLESGPSTTGCFKTAMG